MGVVLVRVVVVSGILSNESIGWVHLIRCSWFFYLLAVAAALAIAAALAVALLLLLLLLLALAVAAVAAAAAAAASILTRHTGLGYYCIDHVSNLPRDFNSPRRGESKPNRSAYIPDKFDSRITIPGSPRSGICDRSL